MSNDSKWCELKQIEETLIRLGISDFGIHSGRVRFNYIFWLASDEDHNLEGY
jgi:hypothetical protein